VLIQLLQQQQQVLQKQSFFCGMFTRVISPLVIVPTKHIKCQLQVNNNNSRGLNDAFQRIVASYGVFTGLYQGFGANVLHQIGQPVVMSGLVQPLRSTQLSRDRLKYNRTLEM
jgi:hypothetical protein